MPRKTKYVALDIGKEAEERLASVLKLSSTENPDDPPDKSLERQVGELSRVYFDPGKQGLPSRAALDEITPLIEQLADKLAIKKVEFGSSHGVLNHIDRDYTKIGLKEFVQKLVQRIAALPVPPATRLKLELAKVPDENTNLKNSLKQIQQLLKARQWHPKVTAEKWRELYPVLMDLVSDEFKRVVKDCKPRDMQEIDFVEYKNMLQPALGFAAFHDLLRQHLIWLVDYEPKVKPVVQWLMAFGHEKWDKELRNVLHGSAVRPIELKQQFKKMVATERQRRSRKVRKVSRKSVTKTT